MNALPTTGRSIRLSWLRGGATVETVLWLPVYVFFLTFVFDISMIFLNKSQILRLVQDANRAYSVGALRSLDETEARIRAGVAPFGANADVRSTEQDGIVVSRVQLRAGDLSGVGLLRRFANLPVTVSAQHLVEG